MLFVSERIFTAFLKFLLYIIDKRSSELGVRVGSSIALGHDGYGFQNLLPVKSLDLFPFSIPAFT